MSGRLVAILHSLPVTSGERTRRRVDLARRALDCESAVIANLYPRRLENVNALQSVLAEPFGWTAGRDEIAVALADGATDVLLGYGVQQPTGPSRVPYQQQLHWLAATLEASDLRLWGFGQRPSHPSRWQRVVHRHEPGAALETVVSELLLPLTIEDVGDPRRHCGVV